MVRQKPPLNFTKRGLQALKPPKRGRQIFHDSETRGLCLLVQPTGYKSFAWYRKVHGQPTWITIGAFPEWTVELARGKAGELNSKWAMGEISTAKKPTSATLGAIFEQYKRDHLQLQSKNPARATKDADDLFRIHLGHWRNRQLTSIRRADVRELHRAIGHDHRYAANRVLQMLKAVVNWALNQELWLGDNPTRGIKLFPEPERTRFAAPDELPRFFAALEEANRDLHDFVLLALFTGARKSDVLAMRWEEITQDATGQKHWRVPAPKSGKPYNIPLMPEALAILAKRRGSTSPWVFPGTGDSGHVKDLKKSWKKFLAAAKIRNFRIHDLRRTLGSWQAASGTSLHIIGKSLGHSTSQATAIYSQLQLDPVRASMSVATRALLRAGEVANA